MLVAALAGCAGSAGAAPSDQDLVQAVRAMVKANIAEYGSAKAQQTTVERVQNLGCNLAPDHRGYLCQTVIETRHPDAGAQQMTRIVRMLRTPQGWHAVMQ